MPNNDQKINIYKITNILLILITCIWFIPFYTKGIDFSDTSFYLVKYKYFFDSSINITTFSTFFSDLTGSIIYHIFPSHQLLILNFVSAICYTVSGFLICRILKDYVPHTLLLLTTLGCNLLTLSYIHCFNYNTASMFNLTLAITLLTLGLFRKKNIYIGISGFIGAANILFRLPNVLHLCIALGILLYCYNQNNKKWKDTVRPLLIYIGGCIAGGIISLVIAVAALGVSNIRDYLTRTFATFTGSSDSSDGHSAGSMFSKLAVQLKEGGMFWCRYVPVLLAIILITFLLCHFLRKNHKIILTGSVIVSCIYGYYVKSSYNITPDEVSSTREIRNTFVFILLAVMLLSFIGIFAFYKTNRRFSYLCLITLLLELVITLGTDTGTLYNTVFLYLPAGMLCCLFYQYYILLKDSTPSWMVASVGTVIVSFSLMLLFWSGFYRGTTYIYRDDPYPALTEKCDIAPLNGMHSSPERIALIRTINRELEPYKGKTLITLGDCNIATVITDLKPFFTNPWPDLTSFSEERFSQELKERSKTDNYPVILFSPTTSILNYNTTGQIYRSMEKEQLLLQFIEENNYSCIYEEDSLIIYAPKQE